MYAQLGFLAKYWDQPRFSIRDGTGQITHSKLSFPALCKKVFGIDMPEPVQDVDLEGWVLALAMSDAKAFGPYKPNDTMTRFCEKTAKSIWEKADELRIMGNAAAHEIIAPNPLHLVAALEIAETLLKTIYILPDMANQMKKVP